jgi:dihydrofolate synthase/folylpolyglutamate synthase
MNGVEPSFERAEAYLLGTINETLSRKLSYTLDRMRSLLHELGDPHRSYPTVHIGGTSGKGSTATMIASVLQASGKRTGLHAKPHLRHVTERARIDGIAIEPRRFAEVLDLMMPAIERTTAAFGRPSFYETTLALALMYFALEHVDVAVVEVGLGGRLDGTNLIIPEVAAITSVGLDHTEVLGETIPEIAREKAGIAKPGVPLVVAATQPEALDAIEAIAGRAGAPIVRVSDRVRIEPAARNGAGGEGAAQAFTVVTAQDRYDVRLPVLGLFQQRNAATAIAVLEQLPSQLRPDRDAVERGLALVSIPGRMEYFPGRPPVIFDIAHNPEKAQNLVASLRDRFPGRHVSFVVAIGVSKDARDILAAFASIPSSFTFTTFEVDGREAVRPARLCALAESLGTWGRAIADPAEALALARRNASADDIVVVSGSTYIVAVLREWWISQRAEHSGAR